jgi:AraC-like DNA-binding protein
MNTLLLLTCAGLAVSVFTAAALAVSGGRAKDGRIFLSIVCLQASLLFLKDVIEETGGPAPLVSFLIFANFLFGLPALYLFLRATSGVPTKRPLLHFLPAIVNLPVALLVAQAGTGSPGVDGAIAAGSGPGSYLPLLYLNVLAAGETVQLVLYARAGLRCTARASRSAPERTIVVAVVGCYAVYYGVRWTGLVIRLFDGRGAGLAALPGWVNASSMVFIALFVALVGVYVVTRMGTERGEKPVATAKYGGRPLAREEAKKIAERAACYLATCKDLSPECIDPRQLAERLEVPYYLLSRAINEYGGRTVADLIREARIERAKSLLVSRPRDSILKVALESGFSAKSSFNEAFKKTVGMNPGTYRRRQRAESPPVA